MKEQEKTRTSLPGAAQKLFPGLWLVIVCFVFISCANTTPHISDGNSATKQTSNINLSKIILLPPLLQYESISTEESLSPSAYNGEEVGNILSTYSAAILQDRGAQIIKSENFLSNPAYNHLLSNRIHLFRSTISQNLVEQIKSLSEASDNIQVLVLMIKVKIGKKGHIEPIFSGTASSGSSYTRLKAVLFDATTGKRAWNNEVQLLERPKPKDSEFVKAINLLYKNLKSN